MRDSVSKAMDSGRGRKADQAVEKHGKHCPSCCAGSAAPHTDDLIDTAVR
jgi:hypothetical protein